MLFKYLLVALASCLIIDLAGQTITCPDDTTASVQVKDYEDIVPDAIVDGWTTFDLERDREFVVFGDCTNPGRVLTIQTASQGNQTLQCTTSTTYPIYTLDDIPVADSVINVNNVSDRDLVLSVLTPELDIKTFNLISTYIDHVIVSDTNILTIIRTIQHLDWCKGDVQESQQIIRITNLDIQDPTNGIRIFTQQQVPLRYDTLLISGPGVTREILNTCSLTGTDAAEQLNCIQSFTEDELILEIVKQSGQREGITTLDLTLTSRYILGQGALNRSGMLWAADHNNSGTITGADIVQMREIILGKIANDSGDFFGLAGESPDLEPLMDGRVIIPASSFPLPESFSLLGIKKGDVNGSYVD